MRKSNDFRIAQALQQHNLLLQLEYGVKTKIIREKNRVIRMAAAFVIDGAQLPIAALLFQHQEKMSAILVQHYSKIIPSFAVLAEKQLVQLKQDNPTRFEILLQQFLDQEGLKDIGDISQTTINDILESLQKGIALGEGSRVLAKRVRDVSKLSRFRAEAIAITETHNAAMFASQKTAEKSQRLTGIEPFKKWVPAADERTRPTHREMWGKPAIPLSEKFKVRNQAGGFDYTDRPGGSGLSASNAVRCRCVMIYETRD